METKRMRKILLILCLLIIYKLNFSQDVPKNLKFQNNINKVGKIETTNSEVNIKNADQVIIKIYKSNDSKLLLDGYSQIKDSSGSYLTLFHFTNDEEISCSINLIFKFDKPILGGNIESESFGVTQMASSSNSDNTARQFRGIMPCEKGIIVVFKSKEKVTTSIRGIEGIKK